MKQYPAIPHVADAPDGLLESGHLWLLEKIDGAQLRFQLQPSGLVRFGTRDDVYDDPDAVPAPYQHAVRHVRDHLDRDALRAAVDDVGDVVFFGEATHRHTIDYDWERTPSFLGFDVWSATAEKFRPPDAAEQIFEHLGLQPVNAFEREYNVRDFAPDSYSMPQSAWYSGPPEGVIIRNKRGQRAKLLHPDVQEAEPAPVDASAADLAGRYATQRRFEKLTADLTERGQPVTVETLSERALEAILREAHIQLQDGPAEMDDFRSEVAALTQKFLS